MPCSSRTEASLLARGVIGGLGLEVKAARVLWCLCSTNSGDGPRSWCVQRGPPMRGGEAEGVVVEQSPLGPSPTSGTSYIRVLRRIPIPRTRVNNPRADAPDPPRCNHDDVSKRACQ